MVAEKSRGVFPFSSSGLKHVPSSSWNVVLSSFFPSSFFPRRSIEITSTSSLFETPSLQSRIAAGLVDNAIVPSHILVACLNYNG